MSRGQGNVFYPKDGRGNRSAVAWLDYSTGGQRHRESSGVKSRTEARRIMRERMGNRENGKIVGRPEKVFLAEYATDAEGKKTLVGGLRWLHETQMQLDGKVSLDRQQQCWNNIEKFFPAPTPVMTVTETRLDAYAQARLKDGAARQTVNNELSALRRGMNLAVKKKVLAVVPVTIELPKVENTRDGFFSDGDFATLILELADYCRPVIRFLYATGWRVNEALGLTWDRIDWEQKGIRLSARQTKGKKSRLFPFALSPDLRDVLETAREHRDGPYVFQGPRAGKPLGYTTLLHHWQRATKRAACPDRIIHDLRRSAVRAFALAGVDRNTIKALCGIHTDSIFTRYDIVDEGRLAEAVGQRYGKATARQTPSTKAA